MIISDNASTDATEEISRSFVANDSRFRYYRNDVNRGIAFNWNRTFELASGRYFKWAAHDDICGSRYLEVCVEIMNQDPSVVLCYPRGVPIDENGQPSGKQIVDVDVSSPVPVERFAALMSNPFWATPLFGVIRREALASTNLLGDYIANDHVLLTEIAMRGRFKEAVELAFFHRHYPAREIHQRSAIDRAKYMYAAGADLSWPRLRLIGGYLAAIQQADLTALERARCRAIVIKWLLTRTRARILRE